MDELRRSAIVRLLRTRDDHLPQPIRHTEASTGFVHNDSANRESCPDCLANDRVTFGCETCGGSGWAPAPRQRDPYAVDVVAPIGFAIDRHDSTHARDRQIDALEQQLRPPRSEADLLEEANRHPYGWEAARDRMYEAFDYGPLDRVLEQLRDVDDSAYHLLHAVDVYAWLTELSSAAEAARERGLAFLSDRLPGGALWPDPKAKLRAPAAARPTSIAGPLRPEAGTAAKDLRDRLLRSRAADGASPAELAKEFRVSLRTVYRVVSEEAAA